MSHRMMGKVLVSGEAEGPILATDVSLSFWGGLDPSTGEVIDRHHPLSGSDVTGRVLVLPSGRGSCTGSGILLEAVYSGHSPKAIILKETDEIIALGAVVAEEMLQRTFPVVVLDEAAFRIALEATYAFIDRGGQVLLEGAK